MSNECASNGEIIRTYLIDDYSTISGCTTIVDEINSCSPSGITINSDVFVNGSLYSLIFSGGTFYGDGSQLSGISTDNFYVTGGTFDDNTKTLTLFRNDGNSVLITGFTDYYVTGGTYSNGSLTLERQDSSFTISGFLTGTTDTYVTGFTYLNNNLIISQNEGQPDLVVNISLMTGLTIDGSFSATTYLGLPIDPDNYVTGGTYSNGTLTLDRQNGSVSISGFLSADTYVTGFTFNTGTYDLTILQNNGLPSLTQNLGILAGDITVTGGTYNPSNGVATFYNNAGGSFQVPGFLTGFTDIYVTSGTYNPNNGNLTLTRTDSVNVVVTGFTDYYITGGTYSNGTLTLNRQNGSVNISGLKFTGNTSGDCITDLYVQNLNSCSPLHIQPTNSGDIYIGENGGVNVGIGTSSPSETLDVSGKTKTTTLQITSGATSGYVLTALDSNGNSYWAPSVSATTDTDNFVSGGTYSNGTLTLDRQNGFVSVTGFSQYFISGSTPTGTTISYGDRWYNTNNGIELVYITDGNSDQWVQPLSTPGPQGPPGYSNLMITSGITTSAVTLDISVNYYGVVHNSNVDISLPNPSGYDGYNINIKDESGNANIYRIRLTPLSGLIDGNNYVDMNTNYMSLHIIARNNNWWII